MSKSPGVYTQEKDLTFNIQSITSNAAGYVGLFRWGPVEEIVQLTTNESELVATFGQPDSFTTSFFHAAANYMQYSIPLSIVRASTTGARNAKNSGTLEVTQPLVNNNSVYETANLDGFSVIGRYPGDFVNGVTISMCKSTGYATWDYADFFSYTPTGKDFNVVVIDTTGNISGIVGTVLERYELVNLTTGSKKTDGTSANLKEVIRDQSKYILIGDIAEIVFTDGVYEDTLEGGVDDNVIANGDFVSAWQLFSNVDNVEVTRVFASFSPDSAKIAVIDLCDSRQDCIAFIAPELADVYNNSSQVNNLTDFFTTTINKPSSYSFQVDNWKMVYDKYNDKNIWIPCDSDAAGLHARVFVQSEPWQSPAGFNRGQLKNVVKLAWSSNQAQRDVLYKYSINSITAFKGEGTVLFGDKTALMAPSAFSRINVRTLFIVIKKAISRAARYQLFELNDFITQSLFRNATDRYLDDIRARRGVYDKRVVCDSTNNTPQVVDSNEFVGDIYVKPTRSINVIRLNFIAVGTGVEFTEVEGA